LPSIATTWPASVGHPPERVVRRNAVFQWNVAAQPVQFRLAPQFNPDPAIRARENCAQRYRQHFRQVMGRSAAAGILQVTESFFDIQNIVVHRFASQKDAS
jgi:hypothetical protein